MGRYTLDIVAGRLALADLDSMRVAVEQEWVLCADSQKEAEEKDRKPDIRSRSLPEVPMFLEVVEWEEDFLQKKTPIPIVCYENSPARVDPTTSLSIQEVLEEKDWECNRHCALQVNLTHVHWVLRGQETEALVPLDSLALIQQLMLHFLNSVFHHWYSIPS